MRDARIFHVNVNCGDLERSRRFYADALGLNAAVRTAPDVVQPGVAFGLERARWDAWVLVGASGFDGGAVDLLEWQEPAPAGAPPSSFVTTGFQRLGIAVPDLEETVTRATELGGAIWSDVQEHELAGGASVRLVMANDPDGVVVELIEGKGPRLSFVAVGCIQLDRSVAFYRTLGFTEVARFAPEPRDAAHLRLEGPAAFDEVMLAAPGGGEVQLILVGFRTPAVVAGPARPANALGMWRMAMLVRDLEASCAQLVALGVDTISPPVTMSMGPELPVLRFVCFAGPDGEVVELIEPPQ
jgi:catechol 2,3-dioxygenase-like lactoylglutathione lyase family enzyme